MRERSLVSVCVCTNDSPVIGNTDLGCPRSDLQLHLIAIIVLCRVEDRLCKPPRWGVGGENGCSRCGRSRPPAASLP